MKTMQKCKSNVRTWKQCENMKTMWKSENDVKLWKQRENNVRMWKQCENAKTMWKPVGLCPGWRSSGPQSLPSCFQSDDGQTQLIEKKFIIGNLTKQEIVKQQIVKKIDEEGIGLGLIWGKEKSRTTSRIQCAWSTWTWQHEGENIFADQEDIVGCYDAVWDLVVKPFTKR